MEQKLFIAACVMYVFSIVSKWLLKKNKLENLIKFSLWNACFVLFFLECVYGIFSFILSNGEVNLSSVISKKDVIFSFIILGLSGWGFVYAYKNPNLRSQIIHTNLDWSNTVYFAGFVASIIMFFFVQAFKIPSASMYRTLRIGDHLFVNKAVYGFRIPFTDTRFFQTRPVAKGDIIVFSFPATTKTQINCGGYQYGRDYVKRVVALPGDKVEIKQGQLYINDQEEPLYGYEVFRVKERTTPVIKVADPAESTQQSALPIVSPAVYQTLWEGRKLEHELGMSLRDNFGPVIVPAGSYFTMGDNRDDSCDSRFWGPVPFKNIKGIAWFIHWPLTRIRLIK